MTLDSSNRPNRRTRKQEMWPTWMWIAIPVLVVVVVVAFWWALFAGPDNEALTATATPTMNVIRSAGTRPVPTEGTTPEPDVATPTLDVLLTPLPPTLTKAPEPSATPETRAIEPAAPDDMAIGSTAKVVGTGGVGLNMRAGAGTGHARIKTLPENSLVELIGGPTDANGYTWWQIRDENGTTGWGASKFLEKQ